ncbi:MAG: nickel pincer cofactor biosynthesis protein LarB [Coriobacteriales bacterium]|nr:nickel pincer cofactor biosynthesis protein LarB [Coriobacteriales bacterium]
MDGFADLDFAREERCGFPEVVFGAGKTPAQVASIMQALAAEHTRVLCTRASAEQADTVQALLSDAQWVSSCNLLYIDRRADGARLRGTTASEVLVGPQGEGCVVVCCAGTSDLAVAQEAALTARLMGSHVNLLTDVGVSGVHRVLAHADELRDARAIVAVAGMEGALPSLVAGMVDVPVVAVPTSVGYGASFGGIAALLGMLNSCAGGVSVVNIDNGFGAGVTAHRINVPPARFAGAPA